MAASTRCLSLRRILRSCQHRKLTYQQLGQSKRTLLSKAYRCDEVWKERLLSPVFQSIKDPSNYAISLRENYEKTKSLSVIDMDVLANCMENISAAQLDYMEDLFRCFAKTQNVLKMTAATSAALVRAYIHHHQEQRLMDIIKQKIIYRVFLEEFSANILLVHLIDTNQISLAAQACYEFMLQEDFRHPITKLLSVYVCTKYIDSVCLDPPEVPTTNEDEEEDWIPVNYISNPHFDFHFDLNEEKLLLGKTMLTLSDCFDGDMKLNLQIIGHGLFENHDSALHILSSVANDTVHGKVYRNIFEKLTQSLDAITTRDPNIPTKEPGFLRNEDDRNLYRPTVEEKQSLLQRLQELTLTLEHKELIHEENFHDSIKESLESQVRSLEESGIHEHESMLKLWVIQRDELLSKQVHEHYVQQKTDQIVKDLKDLQDKEELLTYFEKEHKIDIAAAEAPPIRVPIDWEALKIERYKKRRVRMAAIPNPEL